MNHQEHQVRQGRQEASVDVDAIARVSVDAGLKVHRTLGPGLLESVYEACFERALGSRGLVVQRQIALPVHYEGLKLDAGYRLDLLVENAVVVEIKAVEIVTALHRSQLLTYLRLSGCKLGLLMNFNTVLFKNGL